MNAFNEHAWLHGPQEVCGVGAGKLAGTEMRQSRRRDDHFEKPVALMAGNHHLPRSLIGDRLAPATGRGFGAEAGAGLVCALPRSAPGATHARSWK